MKKENWIWSGHAGHLCIASECRFHLSTYVGGYIVSTVGEWWPSRISREIHAEIYNSKWLIKYKHLKGDNFDRAYMKEFGYQNIGSDATYETMVFKSKKTKHKCCPYVMDGTELEVNRYNDSDSAHQGHMELCKKWAEKKAL